MRQMPDLTGLPTVLDALLRPWVSAIGSTGLGMGSIIANAADERRAALAALAVLTDALRQSQPSEGTRALGLGW